ncbi:hypothetical protein D3C84_1078370 [compost metagenome]
MLIRGNPHRFRECVDVLKLKSRGERAKRIETGPGPCFNPLDGSGCRLGELCQSLLRPLAEFAQIPDYVAQFTFAQYAGFNGVKITHLVSPVSVAVQMVLV